ncbi:MAG: NADH-quinone oxidoreductase subunit C [Acidobacteriota bacterium]
MIEIENLPLDLEKILKRIRENFSQSIEDVKFQFGELTVRIKKEFLIPLLEFLKTDEVTQLNFLSDLTAVDYPDREKRFELVYHLFSIPNKNRLRIKLWISEKEKAPSITRIWEASNWLEREIFDMFGIEFEGHPDLKRILLSEDWEGHPLRKDYPLIGDGKQPY